MTPRDVNVLNTDGSEMWFEVINRLQEKYTIIAPSFPVMTV